MDAESVGDAQEPADTGIGRPGLDALDREALHAGQVAEPLLCEVRVKSLVAHPFADASALVGNPVEVGVAGHSTNAHPAKIMSQPTQTCFM